MKSIKYKRSPLVQGGLEIPVAVNVHWQDKRLWKSKRKTEEVSYPLGETEHYQSKEILKEEFLSVSDPDESIERAFQGNLRSGPILAVLIHSL